MSVTTTPERTLPSADVRTVRALVHGQVAPALWFAAIVVVLWLGAMVVTSQVADDVDHSLAQYARQGTTWFPFSMGVTIFMAYHVPHIAAGMTRRVLARASLVAVALTSLGYAALVSALFGLEALVYRANGWEQAIFDDGWFPVEPTRAGEVLLAHLAVIVTAQVSGLLVAATYQRGGAWRGTFALPLTVGPLLLSVIALSRGVQLDWLTPAVRVAVCVAVVLAMASAYVVVVRGVALKPPRT